MSGEVLAHLRPPGPRADATEDMGGEKGPRAVLGTAGERWPVRGDGSPKTPPKCALDEQTSWERSLWRLH